MRLYSNNQKRDEMTNNQSVVEEDAIKIVAAGAQFPSPKHHMKGGVLFELHCIRQRILSAVPLVTRLNAP